MMLLPSIKSSRPKEISKEIKNKVSHFTNRTKQKMKRENRLCESFVPLYGSIRIKLRVNTKKNEKGNYKIHVSMVAKIPYKTYL